MISYLNILCILQNVYQPLQSFGFLALTPAMTLFVIHRHYFLKSRWNHIGSSLLRLSLEAELNTPGISTVCSVVGTVRRTSSTCSRTPVDAQFVPSYEPSDASCVVPQVTMLTHSSTALVTGSHVATHKLWVFILVCYPKDSPSSYSNLRTNEEITIMTHAHLFYSLIPWSIELFIFKNKYLPLLKFV